MAEDYVDISTFANALLRYKARLSIV